MIRTEFFYYFFCLATFVLLSMSVVEITVSHNSVNKAIFFFNQFVGKFACYVRFVHVCFGQPKRICVRGGVLNFFAPHMRF